MSYRPPDIDERKAEWRRQRALCGLTDTGVARVIGKRLHMIRQYKCATGTCPPREAVERLRDYNLRVALETIAEKFGPDAVRKLKEAA